MVSGGSFVQVTVCLLCLTVHGQTSDHRNEVFNVEHLKDCICENDDSGVARQHGVLVMYETSCARTLQELGVAKVGLPGDHYLAYMEHDIGRLPQCHWYDLPREDQLSTHFPVIGCPTVYFLKRGRVFHQEPEMWLASMSSRTFAEWVWDQVLMDVQVVNRLKDPVLVQAGGIGPHKVEGKVILPGEEATIQTCESHLLSAFKLSASDPTSFMDGWVVSEDLKQAEVKGESTKGYNDWYREVMFQEQSKRSTAENRMFSHTYRLLLNLKQALIVPKFTDTGYKKLKAPAALYEPLLKYYTKHKENRRDEHWNLADSILNQGEVRCSMVHLDDSTKALIIAQVQPVLEEWASIKLQPTVTYGIREYYTGSVLKNHVDRGETHVISAILQISKELQDAEDWPLEVISYDGSRQDVYLESGEMLLYESAKLIHGRPRPLKGYRFANVFIHFKPLEQWEFKINLVPTKNLLFQNKTENLLPLDTDLTKSWKNVKDEL